MMKENNLQIESINLLEDSIAVSDLSPYSKAKKRKQVPATAHNMHKLPSVDLISDDDKSTTCIWFTVKKR